ncbi:MAG: hypothetical protein HKN60_00130, partial [Rhizobiales bacterium]|nr:hypothetical protein [Hyphomicrobiales bacterium]
MAEQENREAKIRGRWLLAAIVLLAGALPAASFANAGEAAFLQTNEAEIARLNQTHDFDTDDPLSVFAAVFAALDDEIEVLPSENYYFFRFLHHGV